MSDVFSRSVAARTLLLADPDPHLAAGDHWRIEIPPSLGVPIAPTVIWPGNPPQYGEALDIVVTDAVGRVVSLPADVDTDGPLTITITDTYREPRARCVGWAEVYADGDLRIAVHRPTPNSIDQPVELAVRSAAPYRFAVPGIRRIVVEGRGRVDDVQLWTSWAQDRGASDRAVAIGAPEEVLGELETYAPAIDAAAHDGLARAMRAVGDWMPPFDDAAGAGLGRAPQRPGTPDDERDRIVAAAQPHVWRWLREAYSSDPAVRRHGVVVGEGMQAGYDPVGMLALTAYADPGLARWLGVAADLATVGVERPPFDEWRGQWQALVAVRTSMVSPAARDDMSARLPDFLKVVDRGAWQRLTEGRRAPVVLQLVSCPAVLDAPPDPPPAPDVRVAGTRRWVPDPAVPPQPSAAGESWAAELALAGPAVVGPLSVVRVPSAPPGAADSCHERVAGLGTDRRTPIVPDIVRTAPMRTEVAVEAAATTEIAEYAVRVGDWAGRFGPVATLGVNAPDRPRRPAPLLRSGHDAAAGVIRHQITVPGDLPTGGRPVTGVRLTSGGVTLERPAGAGSVVEVEIAAPTTAPGQHATVTATAVTTDADDGESFPAPSTVGVIDRRPVPTPRVSPVLIATGRRSGPGRVEVELRWPVVAGAATYRVLEAAEESLRLRAGLPPATGGRADRAAAILAVGGGTRESYAQAVDADVAVTGGVAVARVRRPAGQEGITFLRVLSVAGAGPATGGGDSAGSGVESPFTDSPVVPIVVPRDEVPPAPTVVVVDDADGEHGGGESVTLRISARGLSSGVLAELGAGAPQARIVRVDPALDSFYWPHVATVDVVDDGTGQWSAAYSVQPAAWSLTSYAVALRYPGEHTVIPGAVAVPDPDLVPVRPQPSVIESPWGPACAPVPVIGPRPEIPAPQLVVAVDPVAGVQNVVLTGLSPAPPGAPAPMRVELWGCDAGAAAAVLREADVTADSVAFDVSQTVTDLAAVVIDPFGNRHG